jgi:hypothetical protein
MTPRTPALSRVRRAFHSLLAACCAALALAAPLHAQQVTNARPERVDLTGRVLDAATGKPVGQALVSVSGVRRAVPTDSTGAFRIEGVREGRHTLSVSRLGYAGLETEVAVTSGSGAEIRLTPEPMVLERLNVYADRLESRRRTVPVPVRAMKREEILAAGGSSVAQLVSSRFVNRMSCPNRSYNCTWVRGRAQPVAVFIDEIPVSWGLEQLETYHPQDVYLIESYGHGRMIRVYTTQYMEWLTRTRRSPDPLIFWN